MTRFFRALGLAVGAWMVVIGLVVLTTKFAEVVAGILFVLLFLVTVMAFMDFGD